jgi:putative intracellular protease/amidase
VNQVGFQDDYDLLVIPGGASEIMSKNKDVQTAVREYLEAGKYVGMIGTGKKDIYFEIPLLED